MQHTWYRISVDTHPYSNSSTPLIPFVFHVLQPGHLGATGSVLSEVPGNSHIRGNYRPTRNYLRVAAPEISGCPCFTRRNQSILHTNPPLAFPFRQTIPLHHSCLYITETLEYLNTHSLLAGGVKLYIAQTPAKSRQVIYIISQQSRPDTASAIPPLPHSWSALGIPRGVHCLAGEVLEFSYTGYETGATPLIRIFP